MTRAIKATFLAAAVLGLGFGGYLGYTRANEVSNSLESVQYIGPTKIASDFARTQFMHADTDHARQAVALQIQLLEQLELADKSFHAHELAFAYVRLAMVEKIAGQAEAEQRALSQARARDKQDHSRSEGLTDDELESLVKRLDRAFDKL
ncbi:MAG: hypothetical protein WCC22_10540 [Terriglobales bacterium]